MRGSRQRVAASARGRSRADVRFGGAESRMIEVGLLEAANSRGNVAGVHFWHGVEALGFLFVTLGGIGFVEWRERLRKGEGRSAPAAASKAARPERAGLLTAAALCCAAAAGVHYVVMPDHFEESVLYGLFFL